MNLKYFVPLMVLIVVIIFVYSILDSSMKKDKYWEAMEAKRNKIIDFMVNDTESPFNQNEDVKYEGLNFFEIDPDFRVKVRIEKLSPPLPFNMQMTDGKTDEYFKYAFAYFTLGGAEQRLVLLKSKQFYDDPWLFLPFYDETSAIETYGGGRFLNVEYHGEKEIYIDFNMAYNPYCAYTDAYRCPVPPSENRITIKVTAGERNYKAHQ